MRRMMFGLVAAAATVVAASGAHAQDPYLPVNPNGTLVVPDSSPIPNSSVPNGTMPGPSGTFSVPQNSTVMPAPTVVMPGTVPSGTVYPNYGTGWRGWGLFGGYSTMYGPTQANYNGMPAPYGGGGCNTCQNPCAPVNYEFGRGYDGFMTGW
ncbi:hypothetical protein [Planctomicrobium piriforme]|uniref:Uncharacterized protein n=1 Tax=Planctomicrobium piriforme TaxID=1576369 RepID=A0A1I3BJH5_9PLAN|nr:hypothetical protein [Planctomicrobium piriforme]SFH62310.1 hypothetical protein SAMN05421753_101484 [Planctomicrobium piriforme]